MDPKLTRLNPDELHETPGYHHITVVESGPTAYLSGQCPLDREGTLVGFGDLAAQITQVVANSIAALNAVGATPEHVVRTVIYVVADEQPTLAAAWRQLSESELAPALTAAC